MLPPSTPQKVEGRRERRPSISHLNRRPEYARSIGWRVKVTAPGVSHSNPVTQAGFTMIPNAVMLRGDLSPTAKLVYGYLKHLAWRNGSAGVDPPREVIAADLHLSEKTVTVAVRELQRAPSREGDEAADAARLVLAVRRGQGRTNAYVVNDPDLPESGPSRKVDSSLQERSDRPFPARGRSSSEPKSGPDTGPPYPPPADDAVEVDPEKPPAVVKIDGRNLPLDALASECGIDDESPRYGQAVAALNGARGQVGIRHLFWKEAHRWAVEHEEVDRLSELAEDPERFALALSRAIPRKAALYREKLPGATISPTALRDWWLDLERQRERGNGGLSPGEIATFTGAET